MRCDTRPLLYQPAAGVATLLPLFFGLVPGNREECIVSRGTAAGKRRAAARPAQGRMEVFHVKHWTCYPTELMLYRIAEDDVDKGFVQH